VDREVQVTRTWVPRWPAACLGWITLAWLVLPGQASAQPGRTAVAAGNRLYDEGRYDEAHEQYLEALREAPDSPIVPFNDGNALYRTEEFQRAMEAYQQAVQNGDPAVESQAWYNLGNALFRQQQLEPAVEAYKEALRRNSTDTDAKHNFELALEQLQQQDQQQQSDEQQDDKEPSDDGDDQQDQQGDQQEDQQPDQDRQEGDEPEPDQAEGQQDQPPEEGEQQPQPGELSREEAERLLQAINEDQSQLQRQRRTAAPTRPPRRPW
jgi:Ca-activated chloride channel family protein